MTEYYAPLLILLSDMHRRGTAYWGWSQNEWLETIGLTREAFEQRRVHRSGLKARQQVVVIAYVLTHFSNFFAFAGNALQLHRTAATIFGRLPLDPAPDLTLLVNPYDPGTLRKLSRRENEGEGR